MKGLLIWLFLLGMLNIHAQTTEKNKYTILLTGASFASSNNGWFELGCKELEATPINRAVGAEAIIDTANKMSTDSLYSMEELDEINALVVMHVHDKDVASEVGLRKTYKNYPVPFDRSNYAAAYDYVVKKYISECYNLKFHKESKYYGTPGGKPAIIILCTHWHDVRTTFNTEIRKLGAKWGFPVVEFDKYIGFSKNTLHPITGKQYSTLYALDNETVNGVEYGWHPCQGQDQYIQQRMAAIFANLMKKILPLM